MYYLGVDGGGTKTAFCLTDDSGKIVRLIELGTCHIEQVGKEGIRKIFSGFFQELAEDGITKDEIAGTFLGMPGYSEVERWDTEILEVVSEYFKNFHCGNDVVAGWAGSLKCEDGINLVAGTGAIAFGINREKDSFRTSGWGQFCGDEGSAFWIGKKGIECFTKQADCRYEKGPLYNLFRERLRLEKDFDLIELIHDTWKFSRTEIANLAILVSEAARAGDGYADGILKEAACEIGLMVKGIVRQMDFQNTLKISYSGGVFKAGERILEPLKEYLDGLEISYELLEPALEPVLGSALYAYLLSGNERDEKFIMRLKESYDEIRI